MKSNPELGLKTPVINRGKFEKHRKHKKHGSMKIATTSETRLNNEIKLIDKFMLRKKHR